MTVPEPPRPERGRRLDEPPRPERGTTADERGSDASAPEEEFAAATTWAGRLKAGANPKLLLSQADGYPAGVKQFLQFCLILIYPAWLFLLLLAWPVWLVGQALTGILWVLFWPVRARFKRTNPEEYAANLAKRKARSR